MNDCQAIVFPGGHPWTQTNMHNTSFHINSSLSKRKTIFRRQNRDSSLNITDYHMIRLHRTCCWHYRKLARRWRAVIAGFLAALRAWRLAACSRFLIVWSETHVSYRRANLACRFLEDSLRFRNADKVMKWSSCSAVFFRTSAPWSVFDITGFLELGLPFGDGTRTHSKQSCNIFLWNPSFNLTYCPGLFDIW